MPVLYFLLSPTVSSKNLNFSPPFLLPSLSPSKNYKNQQKTRGIKFRGQKHLQIKFDI